MLLNAAKCQGYSFYLFWVSQGKSTVGGGEEGGGSVIQKTNLMSQPVFSCSKLTTETLGQGVIHIQRIKTPERHPCHVETSPLICSGNQWTGFYMIGMALFWCLYSLLWTYITPCSSVFIVNYEQENAG